MHVMKLLPSLRGEKVRAEVEVDMMSREVATWTRNHLMPLFQVCDFPRLLPSSPPPWKQDCP